MAKKLPNLFFLGIDSLRADHMSLYGYNRLTTPHIDKFAKDAAVFSQNFSPSIPTTSGYASMLSGLDVFSTNTVALRHKGDMAPEVSTLAEALRNFGYESTCVGFKGNIASRGFDNYIEFPNWGDYASGRSPKAQSLNDVTIPELKRLAAGDKPFFLFMRHMDPHSPYLPPLPFERMFYDKNESDPNNRSLDPCYNFKPFCDYFATWFPPMCTDKDYIIAQYDGAVAYMDSCIQNLFTSLEELGIEDETLVVLTSDHGETLYDHDCFFDHHGIYDCTLHVPLILRYPGRIKPARFDQPTQVKDIMPTILDLMGINAGLKFDGRSLTPLMEGGAFVPETEMYITECTWMRKHGWRTPQYKYMHALEPDFHHKPEIELYDLVKDPEELNNIAAREPELCAYFEQRMLKHIAKREDETGRKNPIYLNLDWHGVDGLGPFKTSDQAYNTLHIGSPAAAAKLQAMLNEKRKNG